MAGRGSVLAHKFSANRAVAVMRRFREFFSGLVGLRLYTRTESLGEFSHLCPAVVMVPARARASGPPLAGLDGVDRSVNYIGLIIEGHQGDSGRQTK